MAEVEADRQVRKTRAAILGAFNKLILERRYGDIRVADIIRGADIGRSTFYEHFRNKDAILRESLSHVVAVLADAVCDDCDLNRLQFILDHFRENSRLARGLMIGPSAPQVVIVLAGLIEERLTTWQEKSGRTPAVPLALIAAQTAVAQLGLVRAWLNGGPPCSSAMIAAALHRSALAATRVLFSPTPL